MTLIGGEVREIEVKRATEADCEGALKLMAGLDLIHAAVSMRNLWVVAEGGQVVGVAHLERCGPGLFLSSLGVAATHRHMGLARRLMEATLKDAETDVYIYTVIPRFFEKLGFVECVAPEGLPSREIFGCDRCEPGSCRCMKRRAGVTSKRTI